MKEKTHITITRQYGSGGKEVASIIAKKLGIRSYDRKIVQLAAEKMYETDEPIENIIAQSYNNPDTGLGNLGDYAFERIPYHNKMYREQAKVIIEIAKKESAIFLGRCADFILKDFPNTFSFFIYADDEFRKNRAKDHYGGHSIAELDAEDKNRKRYYSYYTGQTWGSPEHYDLMINASHMPLEQIADIIINYIETRQKD